MLMCPPLLVPTKVQPSENHSYTVHPLLTQQHSGQKRALRSILLNRMLFRGLSSWRAILSDLDWKELPRTHQRLGGPCLPGVAEVSPVNDSLTPEPPGQPWPRRWLQPVESGCWPISSLYNVDNLWLYIYSMVIMNNQVNNSLSKRCVIIQLEELQ